MRNLFRVFRLLSIFSILVLFGYGCGGGGGGGDDSPQSPIGAVGLAYTGIETQADITDSNAKELSAGAYKGGTMGASMTVMGVVASQDSPGLGIPRAVEVSLITRDIIKEIDPASRAGGFYFGAIHNESDTIDGVCGGNVYFEITANDETGDYSGTLNFNDYCTNSSEMPYVTGDEVVFSGNCYFSGTMDVDTETLLTFSYSFDNLDVASGIDSFTMDGTVELDTTVSPSEINIDLLLDHAGEVFWINNYTITYTEYSNYVEFEISGSVRYYDPQYGYVLVSTTTPFEVYYYDRWPSKGVLVLEGSLGSAGNSTKIRLEAIPPDLCQVKADTNGDGNYDWDSGVINWEDL